jgi:NAD(P)-dependent dehydrogenase (short-subunit alcohol dehydrogenase family)
MSLHGQTALITGGGKNLGAQIAREIADEGANLALYYNSPDLARKREECASRLDLDSYLDLG